MGKEETTDLEFEARKEKKKQKEKRKKDEIDRHSPLIDSEEKKAREEKKRQKEKRKKGEVDEEKMGKVVKVPEVDSNGGTIRKSSERHKKKEKRKRKMEGDDIETKMNLTNEPELVSDCEKSNGKIMEIEFATNEKKRKKLVEDNRIGEAAKRFKCSKDGDVAKMNREEGDKKKKKKDRRAKVCGELLQNIITDEQEAGVESEHSDGRIMEKKKRKHKKNSTSEMLETVAEKLGHESSGIQEDVNVKDGKQRKKRAKSEKQVNARDCNKEKKKKAKSDKGSLRTQKNVGASDLSENPTPKKASKRVSFADDLEVFSMSDGPKDAEKGLVQGKRFSEEEDKIVKEAVLSYIKQRGLGDEGIKIVLRCKSRPEVKNCWKEIGAALPWRPVKSIYYRAHMLFERAEERTWTPEDYEEVRRVGMKYKENGESKPNWRELADELGKHRLHVKDAWRRIKLPNVKKGHWSQEEYQTLFDLVNKDLRMRALEEKKSKHGMLRENIKWESISETLGTRTNPVCCLKWYNQLTSPLVTEGVWADTDDYRLVATLDNLDACCVEDVDWDNLLERRSGDVCRKRWNQMVKHIDVTKSFSQQVEILSKRYCGDVLEARDVYDSKLAVD